MEKNILKNITIGYYVIWEISDPVKYFEVLKDDIIAENRISDNMRSFIFSIVGDYSLSALISTESNQIRIDEISDKITREADRAFRINYGIAVLSADIKRIILPEQNKQKVFERMVAERERIANRYRAEGEEQAKIIISQTDKDKMISLSKAKLEAEIIIAKAEAEAAEIYASAFGTNEDFYRFWSLLQSYDDIFNEDSTFIMSTDNRLLDLLEMKDSILDTSR